jgi:pyruvate,water dikinase
MLMRIAEYVDTEVSTDVRGWFMDHKDEVVAMLTDEKERRSKFKASKVNKLENVLSSEGLRRRKNVPISETDSNSTTDPLMKEKLSIIESILKFLDKYGFRCINELKLEENTLHDDPTFVVEAICGYMLTQSYDIFKMEEREMSIRTQAESVVSSTISWPKRTLFNWVLFHARRGVRHRENMRFARTKLFGLFRNLFRAVGTNFVKLELLKERQDVFYLTMDELYWFVEGRSVTNNLSELVQLRKREFESYRRGLAPPERFLTKGACGIHFLFPQVLDDLDLLKDLEAEASTDPNTLKGTPCCPGIVTNTVRVVTTIKEAEGLNGEILITARTDPGWVPLYPMCSGLVIERGR